MSSLLDASVAVAVTGLRAGATATLDASAPDASGDVWRSSARFAVSGAGTVSLAQPSLGGSYAGKDPMGLFDLMTPSAANSTTGDFVSGPNGYAVTLTVLVAGKSVATTTVNRSSGAGAFRTVSLRPATSGIYGELELPLHPDGLRPAIVLFGGSEGGIATTFTATMLAAHGYPALALAYFKEPGLPATLSKIPLEYFAKALRLMRAEPGVDPHHVLIYGDSRGAEAALLVGAHFPDLANGVIAGSPSSVANVAYPQQAGAAWTLAGQPVPTAPASAFGDASNTAGAIPVELIQGPVFTVCGQADLVWPSCGYAAAITSRLQAHNVIYQRISVQYPDAGHFIGGLACCFSATAASFAQAGGTLQGSESAARDAWTRFLRFLSTQ